MVTKNLNKQQSTDIDSKNNVSMMEKLNFLEAEREKSFVNWKHSESQNCSAKKMAQAGFFYSGLNSEDDSATCFVCGKDLDGWEPTDDPFSEHEKHAPNCQFVNLRKNQDEMTVEEFIGLASLVSQNFLKTVVNKKIIALKKKSEEIRDKIKNQQF